jgi:DNA-binding NarL/FixJ family response regulator
MLGSPSIHADSWSSTWVANSVTRKDDDRMNNIILADPQSIFRSGAAKILALEPDFAILEHCAELERLLAAVDRYRSCTVIFAAALRPDLPTFADRIFAAGSRAMVIAESHEVPTHYVQHGIRNIVYRNISGPSLVECVRRTIAGQPWVQEINRTDTAEEHDLVGQRVRDRLTLKEMKIVALIVQGCKNKEIAIRLGTTEQVVKNYLRSVFDKIGVSDRLELALFTVHHRTLNEAANRAGELLMQ